jgi:hypothetical protein
MFFNALLKYLGQKEIQTMSFGGIDQLRQTMRDLFSTSNFRENVQSLGIVIDCDQNPQENLSKTSAVLQEFKLPVPERSRQMVKGDFYVSVFLMPDENTPGMLEDLCLKSVELDPAMHCVQEYFTCLTAAGLDLPNNMSKAKTQTYLASKKEVGFGVGRAAEEDKAYWDWNHTAFGPVKAFLQQISSIPED